MMRDALDRAAAPFGFDERVLAAAQAALPQVTAAWQERDAAALPVCAKVVRAFANARVSESHLAGTTGYGYHDAGRDVYERALAEVFGAETAFARLQFASGTHAIVASVHALLGSSGRLASLTGVPYDTLRLALVAPLVGEGAGRTTRYREAAWESGPMPDAYSVTAALRDQPELAFIQRSRGYAHRPSLSIAQIATIIGHARETSPGTIVLVDNCYGELVELQEPCDVGADIVVGSLIKNPGGGVAPGGAYVAGRSELVDRIADAVFAPGLGRKVGASYDAMRWIFAGLHRAPQTVVQSLKILDFAAALFARLGYQVDPEAGSMRTDIIQAIGLGSPALLAAFTQGLQALMPVNAHAKPEPGDVPGYADRVLMAAGSFIGGSTMELSCDAPLREPYEVYLQGGLDVGHGMLACMSAANRVLAAGRHSGTAGE